MPSTAINLTGPAKYRFQDTVAVWLTLLHWKRRNLRVRNEPEGAGEDVLLEFGSLDPFTLEVQVKGSQAELSLGALANVLAHFGGRQAESCLFERLLKGNAVLVVCGGSCNEHTVCYRESPSPLDAAPRDHRAIRQKDAQDLLDALTTAEVGGTDASPLRAKREQRIRELAALPSSQVQVHAVLAQLVVWDRLDEATIHDNCERLLVKHRVPLDVASEVVDELCVAARRAAEAGVDIVPPLREIIEQRRQGRQRSSYHVRRDGGDEQRRELAQKHLVLLSGPPRCGKTEAGKALLDLLSEEGYEIAIHAAPMEAHGFLRDSTARMRACLLDDPFGSRGTLEERPGQRLTQLRQAVNAVGPGRLLIVAQSRDELLRAMNQEHLGDCRLGSADWHDLGRYPVGFLRAVWESLVHEASPPESLAERVRGLLHQGAEIEVGALEYLAFNADLLSKDAAGNDLLRHAQRDAQEIAAN